MRVKSIIIALVSLMINTSCVDSYWPEIDKYQSSLIVDGFLTNGNDPAIVRLSYSSSVNIGEYIPAIGGDLYVTDENQFKTQLIETQPGTYIAYDSTFYGEIGGSYQLHITMPDGQRYESDICSLLEPSPIDSVYGLNEYPGEATGLHRIQGVQFYVDNHRDNQSDTSFYLWKLTQTYKYQATFDIDWVWAGAYTPFPNPDSLRTCWRTSKVSELFLFSSEYIDLSVITKFPLVFVSTDSKKLSIRYSLLVRQLSISKNAFDFFNALQQQNIDQEDFYTQQPIQIVGNVHNINDSGESVLGYFTVAGVTEKRIYINRPSLEFYYNICTPDFDLRFIEFEPESSWPIYIDDIMFLGWAMGESYECFDCRKEGGSITPPPFWEE